LASWRAYLVKDKQAEEHMAAMTGSHEQRETHDLIGSDKVEATNVYRSNGEKIGEIERVMLEIAVESPTR
jgi:hypothetical protein